jgi:uncharacterized iron-regulated protein
MNCRSAVTLGALWLALSGCAGPAATEPLDARLQGLLPTPLLLLGEQHDAPEHQRLQRETVQHLATRGELAALVLEMSDQGRQTTGLGADASEAQVREALDWRGATNAGAWPWTTYGPVVMAAVRAGAPVLGGNLPRGAMRAAMAEPTLDDTLPATALQTLRDQIREGHCGLLPESQIAPMTRIQLARDRAMARTALAALRPGQTVLLIAGNQHVRRDLGVPQHLPAGQAFKVVVSQAGQAATGEAPGAAADRVWATPPLPPKDYCRDMKAQMGK